MLGKNNRPKITVLGSFIVDLAGRAPRLPVPGETVLGKFFKIGPGGKGANQATAAAKLGADVVMITKLGKDEFANIALDNFRNQKIHDKYVYEDKDYPTGTALIMVDEKTGQNMIIVIIGANEYLTIEEVERAEEDIASSKVFLTQFEINHDAMVRGIEIAKRHNVKVILNPAPAREISDDLLSKVDILTPNETEAQALSGIPVKSVDDAAKAGKFFLEKGIKDVIVTCGEKGVVVVNKDLVKHIPALKVDPVETTGAGDAFNGALATAIAEGKDIVKAAEFANYAAALSVTRLGTSIAMPYRHEVEEFIANESKKTTLG